MSLGGLRLYSTSATHTAVLPTNLPPLVCQLKFYIFVINLWAINYREEEAKTKVATIPPVLLLRALSLCVCVCVCVFVCGMRGTLSSLLLIKCVCVSPFLSHTQVLYKLCKFGSWSCSRSGWRCWWWWWWWCCCCCCCCSETDLNSRGC